MKAQLDFGGVRPSDVAGRFQAFASDVEDHLERAMQNIALQIEADAKRNAPVDTGNLRASIESVVLDLGGAGIKALAVGTDVEYGIWQEFGTAVMGAQPFLRPAFEANREFIIDEINGALMNAVDDAGFDT